MPRHLLFQLKRRCKVVIEFTIDKGLRLCNVVIAGTGQGMNVGRVSIRRGGVGLLREPLRDAAFLDDRCGIFLRIGETEPAQHILHIDKRRAGR